MTLSDLDGLPPSGPFTLVIEPDVTGKEEVVLVTGYASSPANTVNIVRGTNTYGGVAGGDGTTPTDHTAGSTTFVKHMVTARDLQEPQNHMVATSGVHGVTGDIVGTTASQILTNKTINSASNSMVIAQSAVTNLVSDLSAKAPIASPAFTGTPTADTAAVGTNNTQLATTAFVQAVGDTKLDEPVSNGFAVKNGAGTSVARTITGSGDISVSNGDGVSGNPVISLTKQIQAGSANVTVNAGTGTVTVTSATTTSSSIVVATAADSLMNASVISVNVTGFQIRLRTIDGSAPSGTYTVYWMVF